MWFLNSIFFVSLNYNLTQTRQAMINWIYLAIYRIYRAGGVSIFYNESLPIKMLNRSYLQECICFDLKMVNKRCTIVSLYKSPSQSADEFENFKNKLNLAIESITQNNPFLTVVIGNFNARSSKWWTDDKTTQESIKTENLLSQCSLFTSNQ